MTERRFVLADFTHMNRTGCLSQPAAVAFDEPPPRNALKHATGAKDEQLQLDVREIYVHYGSEMGRSKLKIPAAKSGTARNMNTVAKLADMVSKL